MQNFSAARGLFATNSRLSNMGERVESSLNLNRERVGGPETIYLEDELDLTNLKVLASWLKKSIFSDSTETSTKMTVTMGLIDKKQAESEKFLATLRSNLEEIKRIVKSYESLEKEKSAAMSGCSPMRHLHGQQGNQKNMLDLETTNQLMIFLIKEMDDSTSKLEENAAAVSSAQEVNRKHLKNIERNLKEAEQKLETCIQKEARHEATPGGSTGKQAGRCARTNSSGTNSPVKELEKKSQATQSNDESRNTPKRRRTDERNEQGCTTPTSGSRTPRSQAESLGSRRTSVGTPKEREIQGESENRNGSQKASNTEVNETDTAEEGFQGLHCSQNMFDNIFDMEEKVSDIKRKLNKFEDIIHESKLVLSSFNRGLDSLRTAVKDELRKMEEREREACDATMDFTPNVSQPFEQQFPDVRRGLFSSVPNTLSSKTCNSSYYDTRSDICQSAIQRTRGPLTPEQLTDFLDNIRSKKNSMSYVLQTTNDVESLRQQLFWVKECLDESYKEFMRQPGNRSADFDRRLQQRLVTLISSIDSYCQYQATRDAQNLQ